MFTIARVRAAESDDALLELLSGELSRRLPHGRRANDAYVRELQSLPPGLRAMAATYELDVSLALDDLGWHFGNWHHLGLAQETLAGLRELGAVRMAELFQAAFGFAQRSWSELGDPAWPQWYTGSALARELEPLNSEAWALWGESKLGLLRYWLSYARAHPEQLMDPGEP
jgi:hypothetical protein